MNKNSKSKISIVGIGPGHLDHMTFKAKQTILDADVIVGYETYIKLIEGLITNQNIIRAGMTEEVLRAQEAVKSAKAGNSVAIISSGDAGLYGMAGLIYEVLIEENWKPTDSPEVEVVPGISAMYASASLLGAPIVHDACSISLSDHLTDWQTIAGRIEAAAAADFVIAIYNPKSGRRKQQIVLASEILLKHRSADTPVGIIKSAYRENQNIVITTLSKMLEHDIGMLTTVIIGNSTTRQYEDILVTPRGYHRKYNLKDSKQAIPFGQRMKPEHEPWSLEQHLGNAKNESSFKKTDIETTREKIRSSAQDALLKLDRSKKSQALNHERHEIQETEETKKEYILSPESAVKKYTAEQIALISQMLGNDGEMEYTHDDHLLVRSVVDISQMRDKLEQVSLKLHESPNQPVIKTCDFCDLQKEESIPFLKLLEKSISKIETERPLRVGYNGCGMSCYGAAREDIGIIYFRGKFEIYAGAKSYGRNLESPTLISRDLDGDEMVRIAQSIIRDYAENAFPRERFFQYFHRTHAEVSI